MAEIQAPALPTVSSAVDADYAVAIVGGAVRRLPFSAHPVSAAALTALATKPDVLGVQQLIAQATGQQPLNPRYVQVNDADYTLTIEDLRNAVPSTPTWVVINSDTPRTLTWPSRATVARPLLATVRVVQAGAGAVTVRGASGVGFLSLNGLVTGGRGAVAELVEILNDVIGATGALVSSGAPYIVVPGSLAGTAVQGNTLTYTNSTVQPNTGTVTRQWLRENVSTGALTNIGSGGTTYVLVSGDNDSYVWVRETITVTGYAPLVFNSNKLLAQASGVNTPQNTVAPFFSAASSNVVGGQVTINAGTWTNSPTSYSYQRKRNGVNDGSPTVQAGTTLNYTLVTGDAGSTITYTVTATNGNGSSSAITSSNSVAVAGGGIPSLAVQPTITVQGGGSPVVGATLVCDPGGWLNNPTSFEYKWLFVEAGNPSVNGYIVPPQTTDEYVITADDVSPASQLNCEVTAINSTGRSDAFGVKVVAIGPVAQGGGTPPPPPPPIPDATAGPRFATTPSGPITVSTNNQTIERLKFTSLPAIQINPGVTGTIIQDCEVDGGSVADDGIVDEGNGTIIRHCDIHDCGRGILTANSANGEFYKNLLDQFGGMGISSHAFEAQYANNIYVHDNVITGINYDSDAVSFFMSSYCRLMYNDFNVDMDEPSSAAFTMGDMIPIAEGGSGDPGHDNYVGYNKVVQTGGVPAGIFGSSGNSIVEHNCFTAGIQAYNYAGVFVGVAVRLNYIDMAASFVPDTALLSGWSTNTDLGASNTCPATL